MFELPWFHLFFVVRVFKVQNKFVKKYCNSSHFLLPLQIITITREMEFHFRVEWKTILNINRIGLTAIRLWILSFTKHVVLYSFLNWGDSTSLALKITDETSAYPYLYNCWCPVKYSCDMWEHHSISCRITSAGITGI